MTEKEKHEAGILYDANYDEELVKELMTCKDQCFEYNQIMPSQTEKRLWFLYSRASSGCGKQGCNY